MVQFLLGRGRTSMSEGQAARRSSLEMGVVCAAVGAILGLYVRSRAVGGYDWFPVFSSLAGGTTGGLLWWSLLARRARYLNENGALIGALCGFVSHYVCWYMLITAYWTCSLVSGGCLSSLGETPMNPFQALLGAFGFSLWSWILFGWITVPVGAVLGALLAVRWKRRVLNDRSASPEV